MHRTINITFTRRTNKCFRIFVRKCHQLETATSVEKRVFPVPKIPIRIKRSPTDLLKAIATTVARDPTAPHYNFHDDPYLYPLSSKEKRNYALSKESGKKAAKWVRDTHGELFNNDCDDPKIEKFSPKIKFDENSEVSESDLQTCIKNIHVSDAIFVYKLCETKQIEISVDTRQALLELVCFYNCEEALDIDWTEDKRHELIPRLLLNTKTWKDGGFAEELFEGLKENGIKPYCAIIRGMCSYLQSKRAWQLYQEALSSNLIPDTTTFNALIRIAPSRRDDNELRWELILELLNKMNELRVPPNLGTMNSVLEALSFMRAWPNSRSLSLQVLSEFKRLNIEPCLATYYFLLNIYYVARHQSSGLLPSILNEIENNTFTLRDLNDVNFFFTAMEVSRKYLSSYETALRVHNFLMKDNHFNLLGSYVRETVYFKCYMILSVRCLPLSKFMEVYEDLVPHIYSPDRDVMEEIIIVLGLNGDLKLLPRMWSDCIWLEKANDKILITQVLKTMNEHHLESVDSTLATQLATIAMDTWNRSENRIKASERKLEWTGAMFGDCVSTLARCNDIEKALEVFQKYSPSIISGVVPYESLRYFFDALVKNKMYSEAMTVLKYCNEEQFPEESTLAKQLVKEEGLPEDIKDKLISTYGNVIVG